MNQNENEVWFYSGSDRYAEFSNMSRHPVVIGDIVYPTLEHYYQATKFIDIDYAKKIIAESNPFEAKKLGASRAYGIHEDWDVFKEHVMLVGLLQKFKQHPRLKDILLKTGDKELIHFAKNDRFWGMTKTKKGKNRLGVLLMDVRRRLRKEEL